MKHMKKRILFFIFALIGIVIFSSILFIKDSPIQTGQIIRANGDSIWITDGYTEIDFENKTDDELAELLKFQGTIFQLPWYIPNGFIEQLTPGQKVKIYYDGSVRLSAPGRSGSYWVSINKEK
jgi:hypothetical protein